VASACAWSVALGDLDGRIVEVEAGIGAGLPRTVLAGLPAQPSIRRVIAARQLSAPLGQEWPISLLRPVQPDDLS
jgi:magnesium chelatase family protein